MKEAEGLVAKQTKKKSFSEGEDFHTFCNEKVTPERITYSIKIQFPTFFSASLQRYSFTSPFAVQPIIMSHLDV